MAKKLIGLTGPSSFTNECTNMVEDFFDADFVMLYHGNDDNLNSWLGKCDAVIVAGGVDIHPMIYGSQVWAGSNFTKFDLERDERELKVLEYCEKNKKPYLGICRGHQLIGVMKGLKLIPDISGSCVIHNPGKSGVSLSQNEPIHAVEIPEKAVEEFFNIFKLATVPERKVLSRIMGLHPQLPLYTNSYHHQALAYSSKMNIPDLTVYGTARVDLTKNIKHVIELMAGERWLAVQWHPEYDWRVNSASRMVLDRFKYMISDDYVPPVPKLAVYEEEDAADEAGQADPEVAEEE